MHREDCDGSQRSFYSQAFSSSTYNTGFFPFPTSKPCSVPSFCALQHSEITMSPYTPKAALYPCHSSTGLESRRVSFTLATSDTSGERSLQAKEDILHHRLPLLTQWRLSVVALMCPSLPPAYLGARKWEQVWPSRTGQKR